MKSAACGKNVVTYLIKMESKIVIAALIFFSHCCLLKGQDSKLNTYWAGLGAGFYKAEGSLVYANVSAETGIKYWNTRMLFQLQGGGEADLIFSQDEYWSLYSLLVGKDYAIYGSSVSVYIESGLSLLAGAFQEENGLQIGQSTKRKVRSLGVPVQLGIEHSFNESTRLGLNFWMNYTSELIMGGMMIRLKFGELLN